MSEAPEVMPGDGACGWHEGTVARGRGGQESNAGILLPHGGAQNDKRELTSSHSCRD
jgi:hypothetical protein